jgi:hypothetical protein
VLLQSAGSGMLCRTYVEQCVEHIPKVKRCLLPFYAKPINCFALVPAVHKTAAPDEHG